MLENITNHDNPIFQAILITKEKTPECEDLPATQFHPWHVHIQYVYGTAQFKLDICTRVLVESLERFGVKLASCAQVHNSSSEIQSSR